MPAVLLTTLLPPPSTPELLLFLQQRTGSSSQPPHICPTCRPQGTAHPAPGTGNLPTSVKASSCHFRLVFPTLYRNSLKFDSADLSPGICLNKLHVETGSSEAGMRAGCPSLPYSAQGGPFPLLAQCPPCKLRGFV